MLVAFNRGLAAVVAELIESYENQGVPHNEAVALAAAWQASYLRLVHEQANQGPHQA